MIIQFLDIHEVKFPLRSFIRWTYTRHLWSYNTPSCADHAHMWHLICLQSLVGWRNPRSKTISIQRYSIPIRIKTNHLLHYVYKFWISKRKTFQNKMTCTFFLNVVWRRLLGRFSQLRRILLALKYFLFVIYECNIKQIFFKGGHLYYYIKIMDTLF